MPQNGKSCRDALQAQRNRDVAVRSIGDRTNSRVYPLAEQLSRDCHGQRAPHGKRIVLDLAELDSTWCEQSDPEIEAWDLRGTRSGVRITVDEGVYLGSVPTMYRILREETLTGEHRRGHRCKAT